MTTMPGTSSAEGPERDRRRRLLRVAAFDKTGATDALAPASVQLHPLRQSASGRDRGDCYEVTRKS